MHQEPNKPLQPTPPSRVPALERSAKKSRLARIPHFGYAACMSTIELSQLTLREKLQIMQTIWEDLRSQVDRFGVPQSHQDTLDERRRRVESGEAKLFNWDQAKHEIGKR